MTYNGQLTTLNALQPINISRAIEKCKKLRGAKKIDFFTETFKLSPSIVNRDCEVSYDKTVNGTVTPDVQKEVPKKHESSKRYRDGTTKSHNTLKHETAKKHKQLYLCRLCY